MRLIPLALADTNAVTVAVTIAVILAGCATPYNSAYKDFMRSRPLQRTAAATVYECSMQDLAASQEAGRTYTQVQGLGPASVWTREQSMQYNRRILEPLKYQHPDELCIVGQLNILADHLVASTDKGLQNFAQSKGATVVFLACDYAGQTREQAWWSTNMAIAESHDHYAVSAVFLAPRDAVEAANDAGSK